MRFLLGLVVGAGIVLALAPAGPLTAHPVLARALALPEQTLLAARRALAPSQPEAQKRSQAQPDGQALEAAQPDTADTTQSAAAESLLLAPIPRPPDPLTAEQPAHPSEPERREAEPANGPEQVMAAPAVPEPEPAAGPAQPTAPLASASAPVWVPFHSEMSASGFAGRLSRSLDHPFRVERRGPGRYQVVFAYRDDAQRRSLLRDAAELTGLPL